jgi:hypothetical protein
MDSVINGWVVERTKIGAQARWYAMALDGQGYPILTVDCQSRREAREYARDNNRPPPVPVSEPILKPAANSAIVARIRTVVRGE